MRQSNGVRVMATPGGVMSSARFLTRAVSWRLKAAARFVRNRFGYDISGQNQTRHELRAGFIGGRHI